MATLYTCNQTDSFPAMHPCGKAAKALRENGHEFEFRRVGGYKLMPWTRKGERDEVRELSGQEDVPVLVTDDGTVVAGTKKIVAWAGEHTPAAG